MILSKPSISKTLSATLCFGANPSLEIPLTVCATQCKSVQCDLKLAKCLSEQLLPCNGNPAQLQGTGVTLGRHQYLFCHNLKFNVNFTSHRRPLGLIFLIESGTALSCLGMSVGWYVGWSVGLS